MRLRFLFFVCGLLIFLTCSQVFAQTSDSKELKSAYLESIYDDSQIILEGIELFIRRDYPRYWTNMEQHKPININSIRRYLSDLQYFEGLLDALYKEYMSFKNASGGSLAKKGTEKSLADIEKQISQMIAYSYLRVGDLAMFLSLTKKGDILSTDYQIPLRDIEGRLRRFPLTKNLKILRKVINESLTTLRLHLRFFSPSDVKTINAYLKVEGYDRNDPVNSTYLEYYLGAFPNLGTGKGNELYFGAMINFFNRARYNNLFKEVQQKPGDDQNTVYYEFPMVKGKYSLINQDENFVVYGSSDNTLLTIERLCLFKGFARSDFRLLKREEKKSLKQNLIIKEGVMLKSITEQPKTDQSGMTMLERGSIFRPGDRIQYGIYKLFIQQDYLGKIEIVPCFKGGDCNKRNPDRTITLVKVFDHELLLSQDIIDLVYSKQKMYGKPLSRETPKSERQMDKKPEETTQKTTAEKNEKSGLDRILDVFTGDPETY